MKKGRAVDIEKLQNDVEWALQRGLAARDLVPMLERLRAHAPRGSDAARFAGTELAEQLLSTSPWRSAVLAHEVLRHEESDRTWAVLGLALSLMGHYRSAARAFSQALAFSPACASYAHNLGHLLDAGLGRPAEALRWLARAHEARPNDEEVAASFAHALVRLGRDAEAREVLETVLGTASDAGELLARWQANPDG
jgi:tetratricopeptide (TPR) repeat protein